MLVDTYIYPGMLVLLAFSWDYPGTSIHLRVYLLKFQKTRMRVKPWFLKLHLLGYLVICAGCIICLLNKYIWYTCLLWTFVDGDAIFCCYWLSAHTFRNLCLLWFFFFYSFSFWSLRRIAPSFVFLFLLDIIDCYNLDQIYLKENG
jgi:hypothetical protein